MRLIDPTLRKVILSTLSAGAGWALAALAPLVTTPVMLNHLGAYRYGAWMMLSSIAGLMTLSDFGITNGITSLLTRSGPGDPERRRLISNSYAILGAVSLLLLAMLGLVYVTARGTNPPLLSDALSIMLLAVLIPTALNVPLGFVIRLLYIDMRGSEASMAPGLAALISVPIALLGARAGINPYLLVFLFLAALPFTYLCLTFRYFLKSGTVAPAVSDWDGALAQHIFRSGLRFVPLSLLVILCNKLDYMIVANFQGVANVASYAIADRVIGIVNAMVTVLSTALWPAFARAIDDRNFAWIKATIIKLNVLVLVFYSIFITILLWKYNDVVSLWLGRQVNASPAMLAFLALSSMMLALASPYFAVANCLGAVREQLLAYLALLAIGLPAKFLAGWLYGTAGIAAGGFGSWAIIMVPAIATIAMTRLKRAAK